MIQTGPFQTQPHRQRALTRHPVGRHITYVVDVKHRHGQQAAAGGRQQQPWIERRRLHVVATKHTDPTKEDQHGQIAETGIAVGQLARGVSDGRCDGRAAQNNKYQRRADGSAAKGQPQQQQPRADGRHGNDGHGADHLLRRHQTALYRARRPLAGGTISAMQRIAIVVGQIRENLQQDRRHETEQRDQPVEPPTGHRQRRAHHDAGNSQRQRARARGRQPHRAHGRGICLHHVTPNL